MLYRQKLGFDRSKQSLSSLNKNVFTGRDVTSLNPVERTESTQTLNFASFVFLPRK